MPPPNTPFGGSTPIQKLKRGYQTEFSSTGDASEPSPTKPTTEMREETYARERAAFVLASWEVRILLYFTLLYFTLHFGVHFSFLPLRVWDLGPKPKFTRWVVEAKGVFLLLLRPVS